MFDWLGDIFDADTFKTIVNGANTAGSLWNAASPLLNAGATIASGINGTMNASDLKGANAEALSQLNQMFTPDGAYAKELRNQLERKDAAAGRRSQYGTRETQLMAQLAKEKAAVMTSPAYQNYLTGSNRSAYGPVAGAAGRLTGGQQGGSRRIPNVPGGSQAIDYLSNLFGTTADATIASQIGGAGAALSGANTPAAMGVADSLGSMFGTGSFLPGYTETATGLFNGGGSGALGGSSGADMAGGLVGAGSDLIGAGLGGAGSVVGSGIGAGGAGIGAVDTLGGILGGTGTLPTYGGTAAGIFGGGTSGGLGGAGVGAAAGAEGAGSAGTAGAGGAAGAGMGAAVALPFIIAAMGMANGIWGRPDGPPSSTRDNANTAAGWASSYGGQDDALWRSSGAWNDWLTPDLQDWMATQPQHQGDINSMNMENRFYANDDPFLAAYMKAHFGDANQDQVASGLGGYNADQYGQAQNYFNWQGNEWERQYGSTQGGAG